VTTVASGYGRLGRDPSGGAVASVLAGAAILAGLLASQLVLSGRGTAVLALGAVMLPVVLWKKPDVGPAILVVAALAVEQFDQFLDTGPTSEKLTARIPLFVGLGGLRLSPMDLLLFLLIVVAIVRSGTGRTARLPRSGLSTPLYCLFGAVVLGVLLGSSHGGDTRVAFMEARPYVYLVSTFVLASVLLTTRSAIRSVLWGLIIGIGFKSAQGLATFFAVRNEVPRPEAVLGHEEAVFLALFLLLTIALWLFEVRGPMRTTATLLAPVVLMADLANSRRAAWLILAVGFMALAAIGFGALPTRRRFIRRIVIALALALAVYLPAFWNHTGGLAQPARAVRSQVAPSPRDFSSDLYRIQEDANLWFNIGAAGPLGVGFGKPIDYALPIVDISQTNPFIKYVPHNGVLYILMRMGIPGAIIFWSVLAMGIVLAGRLARSRDREFAALGALVACVLVGYAFEGAVDQGFFFYRIAFVVGTLLGLVHAARRLDAERDDARRILHEAL
jgi:O-Antigen ligase